MCVASHLNARSALYGAQIFKYVLRGRGCVLESALALVLVNVFVQILYLYASVQALVRVFVRNWIRMLEMQDVALLGVEVMVGSLR